MNRVMRALEEEIYKLCERSPDRHTALEKQRTYSRVGQFLMGSFDGHWWCRYPTLMTFMVRVLELHPGPESVRMFYDNMAQQLGVCTKCVDMYHSAMPTVRAELENEFTSSSVSEFFHKIAQLDTERIQAALSSKNGQTASQHALVANALYEVLSNRRLWSDFRIVRVVSKWLSVVPEAIKTAVVDHEWLARASAGVLQWLVSPDPGVRAWATSLMGKLGRVDLSSETNDGRALMKVLDEWMYILESGSFNTSLLSLDLPSVEELPVFLDPPNCVKTPTNQVLWAALDTIMQHMNEDSLEALLESFDNLPDLVFNYLNDADPASTNPQITFVICKCYGSLLKCLGHRYWNHTVHSPKVVLDLVIQHSSLPSWRVFVTKQLIELLPPLIASMRPPTTSQSEATKPKLNAYLDARRRVLLSLLGSKHRPSHFNDQVLCVAASKAVSTLICDCYEPRLTIATASTANNPKRDDGALPEISLVDFSVAESSFWWPCGPSFEDVAQMWMNHLFLLLVNPENVASLVDHVAVTCTTVLQKHLSLAREYVYRACVVATDEASTQESVAALPKPIVTRLLERISAWPNISTIPIAVHGAMFESIGGVAELMNLLNQPQHQPQHRPPTQLASIQSTLTQYEAIVSNGYLERISDEVLVKGLMNPFRFPVVAQHINLCLLSPTPAIDQKCKRLLTHAGAKPGQPVSSPLESFLITVHRNAEAFLRGLLTILQAWRRHDFALPVALPTVRKVIFTWTKAFELLGPGFTKALQVTTTSAASAGDAASAAANLQRIPTLIGDFCVKMLTEMYRPSAAKLDEPVVIQCLDFCLSFWKFFASHDRASAGSKRFEGIVTPLVACIDSVDRGAAEKRRGAELLMTLSELFADAQTRLSERAISRLELIRPTTLRSIESKKSTDFKRAATRLRQVAKTASFFTPRKSESRPSSAGRGELTRRTSATSTTSGKDTVETEEEILKFMMGGGQRAMSGKAAAREQVMLANARSAASTIYDAAPKAAHSFYGENDLVAPSRSKPVSGSGSGSSGVEAKSKAFSISQVVKGMEDSRPGLRQSREDKTLVRYGKEVATKENGPEEDEDEEEEDDEEIHKYAALCFKIKHTQKAIPTCSLLPFYRHLLQLAMPSLLTKKFESERSDRELTAPPLTFSTSSEYTNAFLPLLLEEALNEVHEGLRKCFFSTKSGHLLRYESEKPKEGMRVLSFSVVESNASLLSGPRSRFARREKLFRNADVVLLKSAGTRQHSGAFIGVVMISESEKGKRRQGSGAAPRGGGGGATNTSSSPDDEELVRVLFLNDGELESVTSEIASFKMEALTASAIGDTEWRVSPLGNLVTSSREYVGLRSVDMLPAHLRATILTPNLFESLQTELIKITTQLDELRTRKGDTEATRAISKLLKRLNRLEVTLTELRSTSIGKAVNKLRKHEHVDVQAMAQTLKDKWTQLMAQKDALDVAPKFVSVATWAALKPQYNQSQLQSIHSVLNNYRGVSLLQGPPGTGKTKTIMGVISGVLATQMPPSLLRVQPSRDSSTKTTPGSNETSSSSSSSSTASFSNFDLVRELVAKQAGPNAPSFSLSGTPASSRLLRHSDEAASSAKPTTIQALKASGGVRARLESKLSSSTRPSSADVVRRTLLGPSVLSMTRPRGASVHTANVLLCAPSNGAVDELVLRIVTDGLVDSNGQRVKVRAPSVHPDVVAAGGFLSIVRLGNAGEDAPLAVQAVCLPHIIKQELEIHPKTVELRALQDRQRTLRTAIQDVHTRRQLEAQEEKTAESDDKPRKRVKSGLPKLHAELTEVSGKLRRLRNQVFALEGKMTASILSSASIIACTLSKAGGGQFHGLPRGFDALIVDEAAQAVELSTLVPIRERVARVVLVGDPKQLPATVKSVAAAKARLDRSLFERVAESGVAPAMLRVQYRMHPFLREFPSKKFYGGMLTDGASVMARVVAQRVPETVYVHACFQPFVVYDLVDTQESNAGNGSKVNVKEAAFCVELCAGLFQTCTGVRTWSVGFVSPYKEQVHVLRREVSRVQRLLPPTVSVEVNTVDGFQGREKDVIVFSSVRASQRGGVGFLKDVRRLNVAITRARFCLFVVGDVKTLRRDETWRALVESAEERRLVVRATASGGFAQVQRTLEAEGERRKHYAAMHDKLVSRKGTATNVAEKEDAAEGTEAKSSAGKRELEDSGGGGARGGEKKLKVEEKEVEERSNKEEMKPPVAAVAKNEKTGVPSSDKQADGKPQRTGAGSAVTARQPPPHKEDRARSSSSAASTPRDRPRDRSRSRGRHDRSASRSRGGSARSPGDPLKRSPPQQPHESQPSKSLRGSGDSYRRRSRSRSRDRYRGGGSDRRADGAPRSSSFSSASVAPPLPPSTSDRPRLSSSSEDQKHRERQQRLRVLREGADARPPASSNTNSRIVQLVRQGASTSTSASRPPSTGEGSLLSSILGTSKQLTSATARLPDKSLARRL